MTKGKEAYRQARLRRQVALLNYLATVNIIAKQTTILNANLQADREYVAPDPVIPFLTIQELRSQANGFLLDAWQATEETRFYTIPFKNALNQEFLAFNIEVGKAVLPDSTLTPEDLMPTIPGNDAPTSPDSPKTKPASGQQGSVLHKFTRSLFTTKEMLTPVLALLLVGKSATSWVASLVTTSGHNLYTNLWSWLVTLSIAAIAVAFPILAPRLRQNAGLKVILPLMMAGLITAFAPIGTSFAHWMLFAVSGVFLYLIYRNGVTNHVSRRVALLVLLFGLGGLAAKPVVWLQQSDGGPGSSAYQPAE